MESLYTRSCTLAFEPLLHVHVWTGTSSQVPSLRPVTADKDPQIVVFILYATQYMYMYKSALYYRQNFIWLIGDFLKIA